MKTPQTTSDAKSDATSFETRTRILDAMLGHVPFDGWTSKSLRAACAECDLPEGSDALFFSGGPIEAIRFWAQLCDEKTAECLAELDLKGMKIRQRVREGVLLRLGAWGHHEDAARRAIAKLALPASGGAGPQILWSAADTIWRALGDTSTDGNYYSKRAVLSAVISTSAMSWLSDSSPDKVQAKDFLDRRIENVMQFEKAKAKAKRAAENMPDPVKFLSELRFGKTGRRYRSKY